MTETKQITVKNIFRLLTIVILSLFVLCSVFVRIQMYMMNRSLHTDEAAVAESLLTRGYGDLLSRPFLHNQTAPALYLYCTKITADLLGKTEMSLRIFSFLSLIGLLIVEYYMLKKAFKMDTLLILLALALTGTLNIYMRYSNEFKPYMSDAFFVLFTLFVYYLYTTGKIKLIAMSFLYCIIILFSSPALFFIIAVFVYEFIASAIINKNIKRLLMTSAAGMAVMVCFILYYFLWLGPVADSNEMTDFWKYARFDIFAFSGEKIKRNLWLLKRLFSQPFGRVYIMYFALSATGFIISLVKKNKISFVAGLTIPMLLIASHFEKYPIWERLYLFAYSLVIIYAIVGINAIRLIKIKNSAIPAQCFMVLTGFILLLNNISFLKFSGENLYFPAQESAPLIKYVDLHIKGDEWLYSSPYANNVVRYKTSYSERIGGQNHDNIIWGGGWITI